YVGVATRPGDGEKLVSPPQPPSSIQHPDTEKDEGISSRGDSASPTTTPRLSLGHDLKPIVGKPADEDIKAIHAVIRASNSMAHLPKFHNTDLSMQLSQHLFGAQIGAYFQTLNERPIYSPVGVYVNRSNCPMSLLPGDESIYTPPVLPSHIPGTLNEVVGAPSDEDIKLVQDVVRTLEHLAHTPRLFDAHLNMKISQHMFNLQFAQHIHDSSEGRLVSETESEESRPMEPLPTKGLRSEMWVDSSLLVPVVYVLRQQVGPAPEVERLSETLSGLAQLGGIMKSLQEATIESKDVLKNMDRMLTLIQRNQLTIGGMDKYYHLYKDPVNRQGKAATRYCNKPKLIDGKKGEAEQLILKELGVSRF
ncbi:unnamed protein product, partial [Rhizoctonia solani]